MIKPPRIAKAFTSSVAAGKVARKLLGVATKHGPVVAYHVMRENRSMARDRRADVEPHLRARLNRTLAGRNGILGVLNCASVREVTFDALTHREASVDAALETLDLDETLALYTYFRYFGDLRVAQFLRVRLLRAHLHWQKSVLEVNVTALAAALEEGEPDVAIDVANTKRIAPGDRTQVEAILGLAHAMTGNMDEAVRLWETQFSASDFAFRETVRGRTVAVVAPAPPREDQSSDIDHFDLVVRTNYEGPLDPASGRRVDISYYNQNRLHARRSQIEEVGRGVPWLVATRTGEPILHEMFPGHAGIRSSWGAKEVFVHASPLAIPIILADLLRFQPAAVKLFNTDFYASPVAYVAGYHAGSQAQANALSHSLRRHEPFSSFSFVKHLRARGLCTADALAAQVLDMEMPKYAERMHELYGAYTVQNQNPRLTTGA